MNPSTDTVSNQLKALPEQPPAASGAADAMARSTRIGLWALLIGFGLFVAWAALAPLEEGVPAPGLVTVDTKRKPVQHLTGGILKEVLVREGDRVQRGQTLMRLDSAVATANLETVRQRYLGLRAMQSRLLAEQRGAASIDFHPDVQAAAQDPQIQQVMNIQSQLMAARRLALAADVQALKDAIQGQRVLIDTYDTMSTSRRSQLGLLQTELEQIRPLVAEGYAPKNRQIELERSVAEVQSALAELAGNSARAKQSVAEISQRIQVREQEYRKEIQGQLADVTREVEADADKFRAAQDELARTELKSPADGYVVGLSTQSVGAVVAPGQKLLDVVPAESPLLAEVQVPPHLIDRVKQGMPVDLRFSSFAHSPQLVVPAQVVSVSADLITEPQHNVSYFLARVAVTPEGYQKLGHRQLQPGMPVEAVFKGGERSLLTYLLHPLVKRMAASMKEE